jgi:hypothetical protein
MQRYWSIGNRRIEEYIAFLIRRLDSGDYIDPEELQEFTSRSIDDFNEHLPWLRQQLEHYLVLNNDDQRTYEGKFII